MFDYDVAFTNKAGGPFPNTIGVNATAPSTPDGTEFVANFINDLWGANQALMDHAGLTPNTLVEVVGNSQRLTAIQNVSGHPGELQAWMGGQASKQPANFNARLLALQGQGVLMASYPDLDAVVYVGDAANPTAETFYHSSDAGGSVRDTAGPYLQLPDMRGNFARGLDVSGSKDPDGPTRIIGSDQGDAISAHRHEISDLSSEYDWQNVIVDQNLDGLVVNVRQLVINPGGTLQLFAYETNINAFDTDVTASPWDTRPHNTAVHWYVRY
jgi:hypothetical protein